jgi:uncharacterized protein (DUF608 family)
MCSRTMEGNGGQWLTHGMVLCVRIVAFREWTIFNQGPAGSGKYGLVDDVWMAYRVGGKAKVLRTQPPAYLAANAVDALTFSGSYPATRLAVTDSTMPSSAKLSVYGYSTLKPTDLRASAFPGVALTLLVENTGAHPVSADFMFTLPFGAWTDCARSSKNSTAAPGTVDSHLGCMKACAASSSCASWQFSHAPNRCLLNDDVPL